MFVFAALTAKLFVDSFLFRVIFYLRWARKMDPHHCGMAIKYWVDFLNCLGIWAAPINHQTILGRSAWGRSSQFIYPNISTLWALKIHLGNWFHQFRQTSESDSNFFCEELSINMLNVCQQLLIISVGDRWSCVKVDLILAVRFFFKNLNYIDNNIRIEMNI